VRDRQRRLFHTRPPAKPSALPRRYARDRKRVRGGEVTPKPVAARTPAEDTRKAALFGIVGDLQRLQRMVLGVILQRGGCTDEELAEALQLKEGTVRARRCELRDSGVITDSGQRRKTKAHRNAVVWIVNPLFRSPPCNAPTDPGPPSEAPPALPATGRGSIGTEPGRGSCRWCGGVRWWRSAVASDVLRCASCHPPATPELVAGWMDGGAPQRARDREGDQAR